MIVYDDSRATVWGDEEGLTAYLHYMSGQKRHTFMPLSVFNQLEGDKKLDVISQLIATGQVSREMLKTPAPEESEKEDIK